MDDNAITSAEDIRRQHKTKVQLSVDRAVELIMSDIKLALQYDIQQARVSLGDHADEVEKAFRRKGYKVSREESGISIISWEK